MCSPPGVSCDLGRSETCSCLVERPVTGPEVPVRASRYRPGHELLSQKGCLEGLPAEGDVGGDSG